MNTPYESLYGKSIYDFVNTYSIKLPYESLRIYLQSHYESLTNPFNISLQIPFKLLFQTSLQLPSPFPNHLHTISSYTHTNTVKGECFTTDAGERSELKKFFGVYKTIHKKSFLSIWKVVRQKFWPPTFFSEKVF